MIFIYLSQPVFSFCAYGSVYCCKRKSKASDYQEVDDQKPY